MQKKRKSVDRESKNESIEKTLLALRRIWRKDFFKDGPTPASFSFIFVFSYKSSSQRGNQTRIVGVEGEDADD